MSRIIVPARTRLVYVESRGWLLGKLGFKVLVLTGVIFVWGPLVAGRPHTMSLVGWLVWAAIALLALGAVWAWPEMYKPLREKGGITACSAAGFFAVQ